MLLDHSGTQFSTNSEVPCHLWVYRDELVWKIARLKSLNLCCCCSPKYSNALDKAGQKVLACPPWNQEACLHLTRGAWERTECRCCVGRARTERSVQMQLAMATALPCVWATTTTSSSSRALRHWKIARAFHSVRVASHQKDWRLLQEEALLWAFEMRTNTARSALFIAPQISVARGGNQAFVKGLLRFWCARACAWSLACKSIP